MKYLLTGHTAGIGKEIYQQLEGNVIGVSRSTGHDISTQLGRNLIVELGEECDVLINNAADDGIGQTELLHRFYAAYSTQEKIVINVGSRVSEVDLPPEYSFLQEYQYWKQRLRGLSKSIMQARMQAEKRAQPRHLRQPLLSYYVAFGYVGTERIREKYPDLENFLTVEEAARYIIETPSANCDFVDGKDIRLHPSCR